MPDFFPRSKDRGLIEAPTKKNGLSSSSFFPRSKDRGLIEAPSKKLQRSTAAAFRDRKIAASLKLESPAS